MGLSDPYVKAIRWASDRIGDEGVVAFITNDSFLNSVMADGMRLHLAKDFDLLYILDLGGNVRINPRLSGTTHNVFGIQVGVSINFLVRSKRLRPSEGSTILHYATDGFWRKEQKFSFLDEVGTIANVKWARLRPDEKNNWLTQGLRSDYDSLIPLGIKSSKSGAGRVEAVFDLYSNGNDSGRDDWVYNHDLAALQRSVQLFVDTYNSELDRWKRAGRPKEIDEFLTSDTKRIKWTRNAKRDLRLGRIVHFDKECIRTSIYRPFSKSLLYTGKIFNKEVALFPKILPTPESEAENRIICIAGIGNRQQFGGLAINAIPPLDIAFEKNQNFPFYTYAEDGTQRRENITDWALEQFRTRYHDPSITKWDIFHYIYAVLHHPEYRERYAANLRRELPRIPFIGCHPEAVESHAQRATPNEGPMQPAGSIDTADKSIGPSARKERGPQDDKEVFRAFAKAGQRLAEIHVHYEQQPEYPLTKTEKKGEKLDYRVTKMKLSKDKSTLIYNQFLTLSGIPKETYEYRLGNRSALEWIVDQYQISTDKRSGITNDPNRNDDPQYILRLIAQVTTVSLETVKIVESLAHLALP